MTNAISGIGAEAVRAKSTTATTNSTTTNSIASANATIAQKQAEIDEASKLQTENNKTIEELTAEVDALKAQIVEDMQNAVNEGQAFSEQQVTNINNAVTQTVAAYLNGEITKDQLMATLGTKLAITESDIASKLTALTEGENSLVDAINTKISQICDLATENAELGEVIKAAAAEIDKAQAEAAASSSNCCDPIGFEQDGVSYDFIVDRDNDGKFDGENEFLGAENGFEEMKALDKDGNGVVEGEELNGLQMVKTDKVKGTQSFVTAKEAGVTSIDLSSYNAKNIKQANGNTLAGNYNLNVNGKKVEGYQTLDQVDWLSANYGNSYGKSINSDEVTSTAQKTTKAAASKATKSSTQSELGKQIAKIQWEAKQMAPEKEENLIKSTIKNLARTANDAASTNNSTFTRETNDLMSQEEVNKKLGLNQPEEKPKNTTAQFMSMAYALQAEDAKKKVVA